MNQVGVELGSGEAVGMEIVFNGSKLLDRSNNNATWLLNNQVLNSIPLISSTTSFPYKKVDSFHFGWGVEKKKTVRDREEKPPLILEVTYPHVFFRSYD